MKERSKRMIRSVLKNGSRGEEGVTLIELLAVIVILAIISAVAVPVVLNSIKTSKINTTKQSESVIAEALNRYAATNNGTFPANADTELINTTNGGPYLQAIPNDAWGNPFIFNTTGGNSFDITTGANTLASLGNNIDMKNNDTSPALR